MAAAARQWAPQARGRTWSQLPDTTSPRSGKWMTQRTGAACCPITAGCPLGRCTLGCSGCARVRVSVRWLAACMPPRVPPAPSCTPHLVTLPSRLPLNTVLSSGNAMSSTGAGWEKVARCVRWSPSYTRIVCGRRGGGGMGRCAPTARGASAAPGTRRAQHMGAHEGRRAAAPRTLSQDDATSVLVWVLNRSCETPSDGGLGSASPSTAAIPPPPVAACAQREVACQPRRAHAAAACACSRAVRMHTCAQPAVNACAVACAPRGRQARRPTTLQQRPAERLSSWMIPSSRPLPCAGAKQTNAAKQNAVLALLRALSRHKLVKLHSN